MTTPRNMFDKIWDRNVVAQRDDGEALIYVDRNFVHEGPFYAFDKLRLEKRVMRRPLKQACTTWRMRSAMVPIAIFSFS